MSFVSLLDSTDEDDNHQCVISLDSTDEDRPSPVLLSQLQCSPIRKIKSLKHTTNKPKSKPNPSPCNTPKVSSYAEDEEYGVPRPKRVKTYNRPTPRSSAQQANSPEILIDPSSIFDLSTRLSDVPLLTLDLEDYQNTQSTLSTNEHTGGFIGAGDAAFSDDSDHEPDASDEKERNALEVELIPTLKPSPTKVEHQPPPLPPPIISTTKLSCEPKETQLLVSPKSPVPPPIRLTLTMKPVQRDLSETTPFTVEILNNAQFRSLISVCLKHTDFDSDTLVFARRGALVLGSATPSLLNLISFESIHVFPTHEVFHRLRESMLFKDQKSLLTQDINSISDHDEVCQDSLPPSNLTVPQVRLTLRGTTGQEMKLSVPKTRLLKDILNQYCQKYQLDASKFQFIDPDNDLLDLTLAVSHSNLEDDDLIYVKDRPAISKQIRLTVRGMKGQEMKLFVSETQQLKSVLDQYCKQYKVQLNKVQLIDPDNEPLNLSVSVKVSGLEEDDLIYVKERPKK